MNVDYVLAMRRACYEGWLWMGEESRGDLWGCTGLWYSGVYHRDDAGYLESVQHWHETKPWLDWTSDP